MNQKIKAAIAAGLALIVSLTVGLTVCASNEDGHIRVVVKPAPVQPVVAVDGADPDRKRDDALPLSPKAQEVVKDTEAVENGASPKTQNLDHPDVVPSSPRELRGRDSEPAGVLATGGGSQAFPGCQTRFVSSYSARGGASIRAFAVHYTAGANLAGYADMNGLTAYASRAGVSWHFLIDREGHCYYSVPLEAKAWTIANLNPPTVNVEVVGRGNEPDYAGTAGRAKLRQVAREIGRRYGIPMTIGAVSNCNVTRKGIITHWMGGPCSGGHIDIRPYSLPALVSYFRGGPTNPLSKVERKIVARNYLHRRGHGPAKWRHYWGRRNAAVRADLRRLGLDTAAGKRRHRRQRGRLLVTSYKKRCA